MTPIIPKWGQERHSSPHPQTTGTLLPLGAAATPFIAPRPIAEDKPKGGRAALAEQVSEFPIAVPRLLRLGI